MIRFREQFQIDLVLSGFYNESNAEQEIFMLHTLLITMLILMVIASLITSLVLWLRKEKMKHAIGSALRKIERESLV